MGLVPGVANGGQRSWRRLRRARERGRPPAHPRAGSSRCDRLRDSRASSSRSGPTWWEPARPARGRRRRRRSGRPRKRNDGSVRRGSIWPGATYCGISEDVDFGIIGSLARRSERRRGRSWWCRDRCRCSLGYRHCWTRSRTLNSSFQRRPSRATHHSCSMPVSVTTVSSVTGTILARWPSAGSSTSIGRELFEIVADVVDHGSGRVVLARGGVEEAKLGGFADHESEFAIRECAGRCLLPFRTARR